MIGDRTSNEVTCRYLLCILFLPLSHDEPSPSVDINKNSRAGEVKSPLCIETLTRDTGSLALSCRSAVKDLLETTGKKIEVLHIVSGGTQNDLLCQLTADATCLPVLSGPVISAVFGNVLVQLGTLGEIGITLDDVRVILRSSISTIVCEPRGSQSYVFAWAVQKIELYRPGFSRAN